MREKTKPCPDASTPGWFLTSLHAFINIEEFHIANVAHLILCAEDKGQDPQPSNHIHVAMGHVRVGQSGYESK